MEKRYTINSMLLWTFFSGPRDGTVRADAVSIADGVMYGNTQPKIYGGFDNTFRYKEFWVEFIIYIPNG
jgi:hypothetical protein